MRNIGGDKPACEAAIVSGQGEGGKYRFTVLTERLLRLEFSEGGVFEDSATSLVTNRAFQKPGYIVERVGGRLEIVTEYLRLSYDEKPFSANGLSIALNGAYTAYRNVWRFGDIPNGLYGTARTLDEADGAIPLEPGIMARDGYMVIDDGGSMLIGENSHMVQRKNIYTDIYFFGYGHDYIQCLKDFYTLSGKPPLLPRYALGNWWSRFYPYTETTYGELLDDLADLGVPLCVAVLDMNWHLTDADVPKRLGSGWTGYTWDTALFPNPARFLKALRERGLAVTLNVHPADGCRPHEAAYSDMAGDLGVDPAIEAPLTFNAADEAYMEAYFKHLHHPHEAIGVDFWWIDWQQRGGAGVSGVDPLWVLNHEHFIDKGLAFSRYPGLGGHRYGIGFSGDTFATWASLAFQPYFTATASNAGYGWWSHDIGGHMHGELCCEMAARWAQFGVFSPIMRLHSSDNPFMDKNPRQYDAQTRETITRFMRLRHKLIPYIYTFNCRCHLYGETLIQPMYYRHAEEDAAYYVPNEYYFGDLIVCPITTPIDAKTRLARFDAWLPQGLWWDVFAKRAYCGGRRISLYRGAQTLPVFAKAGAIVPLDAHAKNGADIPETLEVFVFAGESGAFKLIEGAGDGLFANTMFTLDWGDTAVLSVSGESLRDFVVKPVGFEGADEEYRFSGASGFSLELPAVVKREDAQGELFALLNNAQIAFDLKSAVYQAAATGDLARKLSELHALGIEANLFGAVLEILTAV